MNEDSWLSILVLKGAMYGYDQPNLLDVDGVVVVTQSGTALTLSPCHGPGPVTLKGNK